MKGNGRPENVNKPLRSRWKEDRPVMITGGAGFIGTNLAHRLLSSGQRVVLFDNLSRPGVKQNVEWLRKVHGGHVSLKVADVRDRAALRPVVRNARQVFHFAAQVAVTTSLTDPVDDCMVNLFGTMCLLEELRSVPNPPPLLFTSTNKVYGCLEDVKLRRDGTRYEPVRSAVRHAGIGEERPLNFHSPYGCSKGSADQYVMDYSRTYGVPAVVFRMSCIYGPHQLGTEDQGWIAHFIKCALEDRTITLYGDGMQVRDVLFVDDLVDALSKAAHNTDSLSGQAFNIGGGVRNTVSLIELLDLIEHLHGRKVQAEFSHWRTGDQRYYVSDTRKFERATGWSPRVSVRDGVTRLYNWFLHTREAAPDQRAPAGRSVHPGPGLRVVGRQPEQR